MSAEDEEVFCSVYAGPDGLTASVGFHQIP